MSHKRNLLNETVDQLKSNGKTLDDVRWVGSLDGKLAIDVARFKQLANVTYDSGYGGQEIADDLAVVGDDWWLERHEYDGREWWEFKRLPVRQQDAQPFEHLARGDSYACALAIINKELVPRG